MKTTITTILMQALVHEENSLALIESSIMDTERRLKELLKDKVMLENKVEELKEALKGN